MKKKLLACVAVLLPVLSLSGCSSDLGSRLARAGMNTLMGMGTVFVILIFIAFIISRFKYISKLEAWLRNRGRHEETLLVQQKAAEEEKVVTEEEDETDDLALVAVITAALAASLETSPDKLVVRSIRRKNTNRW